ncbi:MAG: cytochrome c family protein [Bacteroidetes bacterium OLB12]|nr:MAG: cytochrome c family protein [Bacteroidetes bacterium OLB12]HNR74232.1 c-type cytochrome [Cyclobacteriaceae bacterium]
MKNKVYGIALGILTVVFIGVGFTGTYVKMFLPNVNPPADIKIEPTSEMIARGRYLANHVTVCMDCHSSRDWSKFAGPITDNPGSGGEKFGKEMGFPGTIYTPNITPYNLANWTDGELFRAITTGVNKEGEALFPLMPYTHYGQMDKNDIYSIIAYIRTLVPVQNNTAERELDFPLNFLVNTMPKEAQPQSMPEESNQLLYGAYLVNAAGCMDCHSKTHKGAIVAGSEFGGGMEFRQAAGVVRSPNITPDKETGIGQWTKYAFVQRFKVYADSNYQSPTYTPNDLNSPMPWHMYAGMKEADLESIYTYLQSLKPIKNSVTRYEKIK